MLTAQIFDHFSHYCSDLQAGSFIACLRQPVGQQEGVLAGFHGLGRLEQPCSLAAVHWCVQLGIDALASCVAFLCPGLLWSAGFGADHGGRRAFKLNAATGRGSSNLVNAAGS